MADVVIFGIGDYAEQAHYYLSTNSATPRGRFLRHLGVAEGRAAFMTCRSFPSRRSTRRSPRAR